MNKHPIIMAALLLCGFGVLGASLVAFTNDSTREQIAENQRQALLRQFAAIVPQEKFNNILLDDWITISAPNAFGASSTRVYRARLNNEFVAAILTPINANGYSGDIRLIIGINKNGTLAGVRVLQHKETPGLGDKIETRRSDWILGFNGLSLTNPNPSDWQVKRDGGVFDQFTGATITPRGIVEATKKALEYYAEHTDEISLSHVSKGEQSNE